MFEKLKQNFIKSLKISLIAGPIGLAIGLFFKWPLYKGFYTGIIWVGLGFLFYASVLFVGLPSERFDFFTGKMNQRNKTLPKDERQTLGDGGWTPAVIGIILLFIALVIESVFRSL